MLERGYFVTAELKVKDGVAITEANEALQKLCKETIKEPGCNLFMLHKCLEDEQRFLLWERFDDEAAFNQHFVEQHTIEYIDLDLTEIVQYFTTDIGSLSNCDLQA